MQIAVDKSSVANRGRQRVLHLLAPGLWSNPRKALFERAVVGGDSLMDFETVVKKRRMCREFLDRDVPQEKIERVLDLASRYPSAGHTEPHPL